MSPFVPPYPEPHKGKLSLLARFLFARRNVLELLRERNYRMKLGHFRIPGLDLFVVNEPSLIRRILIEEAERYPKSETLRRTLEPAIGNGFFISTGAEWKRQRRMIDPAFDVRRLEELFPLMLDAVHAMEQRLDAVPAGAEIDAEVEMTHVTADVISRTLCSIPFDRADVAGMFGAFTRYQAAAPAYGLFRAFSLPVGWTPTGRRIRRAAADIRHIVEALVRPRYDARRRGETGRHHDVLEALLEARDPETGTGFTFDELVQQLIVLFIAGHETTASLLAWALYIIANCEHVQERLNREAVDVLDGRDPEFSDLRKLKFTRDVVRECLRLYPTVGFIIRDATEPAEFRGHQVPAGATVVVSPWIVHRHREMWDRPDEFDPDRFHTESAKASLKCAYLPFSFGPRVCIGAGFAMQEATLIIACLARRYKLGPVAGHRPQAASRLTVRSLNGVRVTISRREAP